MTKKEDIDKMTDEDLKLTLALAEKYQYVTESDEEEGEEGEEGVSLNQTLESWSSEEGDEDNIA